MSQLGRFSVSMVSRAVLVLAALGASSAQAGSGWVEFVDETGSRLVADPSVGTADEEEKDYAWGDVDKDGDNDIVCVRKEPWTNPGGFPNVLFMNEGIADGQAIDGVLVDRTAQYIPGFLDSTNDRDVILVDVNGDTWLDIVTAVTLSDGEIKDISHPRIYINQQSDGGVWQGFVYEGSRFPTLACAPRFSSVTAGDIDEDGDMDLYFTDHDDTPDDPEECELNDKLFLNDGTGNFSDSGVTRMSSNMLLSEFGAHAVFSDMNGDDHVDLVKITTLQDPRRIYVNYNDDENVGFFDEITEVYFNSPYHISVGDLNNDEAMDIVAVDDGSDRYLLNQGNDSNGHATFLSRTFAFQFGTEATFGGNSYIVDLNNDGLNDVVVNGVNIDTEGCTHRLYMYRNLGDLPNVTLQDQDQDQFGDVNPWNLDGTHDTAIFDINGDGWKDMFMGTCGGTFVWIQVPPTGLQFTYPTGLPGFVTPNADATIQVSVSPFGVDQPVPGTGKVYISTDGGAYVESPMTETSPNNYEFVLPAATCATTYRWYVSSEIGGANPGTLFDPSDAPTSFYSTVVATGKEISLYDNIEGDVSAWQITDENIVFGTWEQADPNGTISGISLAAPDEDASQSPDETQAFVTFNGPPGGSATTYDVDGGPTHLASPVFDLTGTDADVSFAYWFFSSIGVGADSMVVAVSDDGGQSWTTVETIATNTSAWQSTSFRVSDFVTPSDQVRVRFSVADSPNNSTTEGGIDNFQVEQFTCDVPLSLVSSDPPDGAIDARQPFNIDGTGETGITEVDLTFDGDVSGLVAADFSVSKEGGVDPVPAVISVLVLDADTVRVTLDTPFEPLTWTTITHDASGGFTRIGYLPGDVNGNATTAATDLLATIDHLNGVTSLPLYSVDVDRSGLAAAADVLRVIDLLNGAGAFDPYLGVSLP